VRWSARAQVDERLNAVTVDTSTTRATPVTFRSGREALQDAGALLRCLASLGRVYLRRTLDRAVREKVMVAVSDVNACAGCTAIHQRWALRTGVTATELEAIGLGELTRLDNRSRTAVIYATALAEGRFRTPVDHEVLMAVRGELTSTEISAVEAIARLIAFANLTTNALREAKWN
jgi:AhpD family alkylhydroperoxidase